MGRRKQQLKNTRGTFCENLRTKSTGFIRRQTGFIHQRTGFIRRAEKAIPPVDEASPPTDEASPIGPYIFSYFSHSLNISFLSAAGILPAESALKNAFSENLW